MDSLAANLVLSRKKYKRQYNHEEDYWQNRMRNAIAARHERVQIPASRMKREIARILKDEGYIRDFHLQEQG